MADVTIEFNKYLRMKKMDQNILGIKDPLVNDSKIILETTKENELNKNGK